MFFTIRLNRRIRYLRWRLAGLIFHSTAHAAVQPDHGGRFQLHGGRSNRELTSLCAAGSQNSATGRDLDRPGVSGFSDHGGRCHRVGGLIRFDLCRWLRAGRIFGWGFIDGCVVLRAGHCHCGLHPYKTSGHGRDQRVPTATFSATQAEQ